MTGLPGGQRRVIPSLQTFHPSSTSPVRPERAEMEFRIQVHFGEDVLGGIR